MEIMKLIPPMEMKVPICGRSFESFLAAHDVDVIRPQLCCFELNLEKALCILHFGEGFNTPKYKIYHRERNTQYVKFVLTSNHHA
jgi:hypothetical protein